MSAEAVDLVLRGGPNGGAVPIPEDLCRRARIGRHPVRLVLLNLAERANRQGLAWPAQTTIAAETEIHRRDVATAQRVLAEAGLIAAVADAGRRGSPTRWRVLPALLNDHGEHAGDPLQLPRTRATQGAGHVAGEVAGHVGGEVAGHVGGEVAGQPRHEPEPEPEPERARLARLLMNPTPQYLSETLTIIKEAQEGGRRATVTAQIERWLTEGRQFSYPSALRRTLAETEPHPTAAPPLYIPTPMVDDRCDPTRSTLDFARLVDRSERKGWHLVVLDVDVDTGTPTGKLTAHVLASVAQFERERIGERTAAAHRVRRAEGKRPGQPPALPDDVRHRIAEERAAGRSLAAIAADLNADGTPTARGGRWHPSTVAHVVRSVALDAELSDG